MLVTSVPTDTDTMLFIGMLLGTVRVPNVAALVCLVPSVRVNVVNPVVSVILATWLLQQSNVNGIG